MAVTVTVGRTKTGQIPSNGGMIPITIAITSGTAYSTSAGGVEVDLTEVLAEINNQNGGVSIDDVLGLYGGVDNAGYVAGGFAKTSGNKFSIRHWINNGTLTERGDGSSWSSTMKALLHVAHA